MKPSKPGLRLRIFMCAIPTKAPVRIRELFALVQEGILKHCPKMIVQFSTGGRGRSQNERGRMLYLKPDMASLATGSVNFPAQIYENPPQLVEELARSMLEYSVKPEIEVFDVAMLYNAKIMADRGLLKRPCQVQFVMGIPNALPARRKLLEFLISELKELMPDATWSAAGNRTPPTRSQSMVPRAWWAPPHGAGRQHQVRQRSSRPQQRRVGCTSRRNVRQFWATRGKRHGSTTTLTTADRLDLNGKTGGRAMQGKTPSGGFGTSIGTIAFASAIGTTIEWYDFFLFGVVTPLVFNKLFFPNFDPLVGTLLAYTTFFVGFISRPIGGIIFGHYGDRIGRKTVLVLTILIMGVATFLIGLLPTYASVGIWAPVMLLFLRIFQGIGIGGEWGGAVLMAVEHSPAGRRGFYGSWPQIGVPAGLLLSSGMVYLLSYLPEADFFSWGWRIAFLISAVLVAVGLYIRLKIMETPAFTRIQESRQARPRAVFRAVANARKEHFARPGRPLH